MTGELAKLNHPARDAATAVFALFRTWLAAQFTQLGRTQGADALAMRVLAFSQSAATMANAFGEQDVTNSQVQHMHNWLTALTDQATRARPGHDVLDRP